jgi:hypothetical protein
VKSKAKGQVNTEVNELVLTGKFADFLGKTADELEYHRIQWAQVVEFAQTYREFLHLDGSQALFVSTDDGEPIKEDLSNGFVARMHINDTNQLIVHRQRISDESRFYEHQCRVVSPQH